MKDNVMKRYCKYNAIIRGLIFKLKDHGKINTIIK